MYVVAQWPHARKGQQCFEAQVRVRWGYLGLLPLYSQLPLAPP